MKQDRPRCIVCGKPIAKRYSVVWFRQPQEGAPASVFGPAIEPSPDGTRVGDTWFLAQRPINKEEAQRYSNHAIQRIIGWQGDAITGATYWDGESYMNQYFCKDKCAVAQGYASAHHGHRFRWRDN